MKKRLLQMLLIIIFGLSLITPVEMTVGTEHHLTSSYESSYTFNVERYNYRSTYTLHISVPPSLYDYYNSKAHYVNGDRDYAKFVTPDAVRTIAENVRTIASNGPNSDEEFANNVLALVRQIPYSVSARKYPVEAILDNSGDCDVLSFLAASIMKAGSLDVVLLVYRDLPGSHMNIGVYLPRRPLIATPEIEPIGLKYNNKTYWVAECTPSGNWKVGQHPESFAHVTPTIIFLEDNEESSPAHVSSSLNGPLSPSSISMTLSLANSSATEKERALNISGLISPAHAGKRVAIYISQDRSFSKVFQTDTDQLGNYSLTWNVTSTGTYRIRSSLIAFSNYAGSDSDLITFFVDSHSPSVEGNDLNDELSANPDDVFATPYNLGYEIFSSRIVKEFLKSDLKGANVSLSGEFIMLKSEQTTAKSEQTITIPERMQKMFIRRRPRIIVTVPEHTVTVQGGEQAKNQFGFILQNNDGNYSASVRLLKDSDVAQIEKRFGDNSSTFMNASASIRENKWYQVVAKVSKGEIFAELRGENGTLVEDFAIKEQAIDGGEYGILISCETSTFIAFKNLKVESLDQPPNQSVGNIQLPVRGLESLAPYLMLLILLGMVCVAIIFLRKKD